MNRLDREITRRGLVSSRSQAESYIKLGLVTVGGKVVKKPGMPVGEKSVIDLAGEQYVSRAALKLASISKQFSLDFRNKVVLDVGSSTGGFTDYVLRRGARKVIAVDVGTDQLHPSLRGDKRIELHEKTDIRDVRLQGVKSQDSGLKKGSKSRVITIGNPPEVMLVDVSFVSLTKILTHVSSLMSHDSILVAMCKPQFEAGKDQINKGIIKNSSIRRQILKDFETWLTQNKFIILDKADSQVAGTKGNVERFYKLRAALN